MWKYPKYRHLLTPCYLCATATAHRAWLIGGGCCAIRVVHCGAVGSVECGTFSDNICLNSPQQMTQNQPGRHTTFAPLPASLHL